MNKSTENVEEALSTMVSPEVKSNGSLHLDARVLYFVGMCVLINYIDLRWYVFNVLEADENLITYYWFEQVLNV